MNDILYLGKNTWQLIHDLTKDGEISFMSFSGIIVGVTAKRAGTVSAFVKGVSVSLQLLQKLFIASAGAVLAFAKAAAASAEAVFGVFG